MNCCPTMDDGEFARLTGDSREHLLCLEKCVQGLGVVATAPVSY
jgi:hypothetical protein